MPAMPAMPVATSTVMVMRVVALCNNPYFGGTYNITAFMTRDIAVIRFLAIALFAVLVRRRWVDIVAPLLLPNFRSEIATVRSY